MDVGYCHQKCNKTGGRTETQQQLFWNDGYVTHVTSVRRGRCDGLTSSGGAPSA